MLIDILCIRQWGCWYATGNDTKVEINFMGKRITDKGNSLCSQKRTGEGGELSEDKTGRLMTLSSLPLMGTPKSQLTAEQLLIKKIEIYLKKIFYIQRHKEETMRQ